MPAKPIAAITIPIIMIIHLPLRVGLLPVLLLLLLFSDDIDDYFFLTIFLAINLLILSGPKGVHPKKRLFNK